ncbi:MAG TPA: hypothetical protein DCS43_00800 [Verrucomicrobia bacterium]|nr:hypothetical protein [Verrucomicrobiota bacterium]
MAEELQGLLDRIQKEGVERADTEARQIADEARAKARRLIADAEKEAAALIQKARAESDLFLKRSESALHQVARDVILTVGEAVTETLQALVGKRIDAALTTEALPGLIHEAVKAYCSASTAQPIEVLLSESQQAAVSALFMNQFRNDMKAGLTIQGSRSVLSGFRVSLTDRGIQHDFTGEALTEAIGRLLRPQLADIVNRAAHKEKTPAK